VRNDISDCLAISAFTSGTAMTYDGTDMLPLNPCDGLVTEVWSTRDLVTSAKFTRSGWMEGMAWFGSC
jgi:hypothetical protein